MVRLHFFFIILFGLGCTGTCHSATRGEGFLAFKGANIHWDNNRFILADSTVEFSSEDVDAYAVELSIPVNNTFSLGGEIHFQEWRVIEDSADPYPPSYGYANIYMYTLMGRYKFTETGRIRPTLGAGFGKARFSLHSHTDVILEGYTYQLNAAVDFMLTAGTALALSVVRAGIDVEDSHNNQLKNYATIYQLALTFHL